MYLPEDIHLHREKLASAISLLPRTEHEKNISFYVVLTGCFPRLSKDLEKVCNSSLSAQSLLRDVWNVIFSFSFSLVRNYAKLWTSCILRIGSFALVTRKQPKRYNNFAKTKTSLLEVINFYFFSSVRNILRANSMRMKLLSDANGECPFLLRVLKLFLINLNNNLYEK